MHAVLHPWTMDALCLSAVMIVVVLSSAFGPGEPLFAICCSALYRHVLLLFCVIAAGACIRSRTMSLCNAVKDVGQLPFLAAYTPFHVWPRPLALMVFADMLPCSKRDCTRNLHGLYLCTGRQQQCRHCIRDVSICTADQQNSLSLKLFLLLLHQYEHIDSKFLSVISKRRYRACNCI